MTCGATINNTFEKIKHAFLLNYLLVYFWRQIHNFYIKLIRIYKLKLEKKKNTHSYGHIVVLLKIQSFASFSTLRTRSMRNFNFHSIFYLFIQTKCSNFISIPTFWDSRFLHDGHGILRGILEATHRRIFTRNHADNRGVHAEMPVNY